MHFKEYATTEEMFDDIQKGVEAAKARITPEQEAITYGDYWLRPYPEMNAIIFGHIWTQEKLLSEEKRLGATEEELAYVKAHYEYSYGNGFRFGDAYSILEPRGEMGDTHVTTMYKITKEQFEDAEAVYWVPEVITQLPWFRELVRREMEKHG